MDAAAAVVRKQILKGYLNQHVLAIIESVTPSAEIVSFFVCSYEFGSREGYDGIYQIRPQVHHLLVCLPRFEELLAFWKPSLMATNLHVAAVMNHNNLGGGLGHVSQYQLNS